jgi:hypothetical protein
MFKLKKLKSQKNTKEATAVPKDDKRSIEETKIEAEINKPELATSESDI